MRLTSSYVVILFVALILLVASPSVEAQRRAVYQRLPVQRTEQQITEINNPERLIERRGLADTAFETYYEKTHRGRNAAPWLIATGIILALAAVGGIVYWVVARRRQNEQEAKRLEMANKRAKFLDDGDKVSPPPTKRWWLKLCTSNRS
jgi:Flp pilus assembly protein TadB